MKSSFLLTLFSLIFFLISSLFTPALAVETPALLYDSSDHYLGACSLTDKTTWVLEEDLNVSLFQIWYNWEVGETEVTFTLNKDGQEFLSGKVTRTNCDAYQKNWCNGDLGVNKVFPKGSYELKVAQAKQCAIPSGNGTVRLYGEALVAANTEETDVSPSASTTSNSSEENNCDCPGSDTPRFSVWGYFVLGGSLLINLGLIFMITKKPK